MDFSKLDAIMEELPERWSVPGADIMVYADHQIVHRKQVGWADSAHTRPVAPRDMYTLYSVTKTVTMTAVARLLERGLLHLDDRLDTYLPEFRRMGLYEGKEFRAPKSPITIRHLMTMSAGLTYNLDTLYTGQILRRYNGHATTRQVMEPIAAEPLLFDPGTKYSYSLGHDVLAAVIEVVTGETFGSYVQKNIFDPLGMEDATFHPTPEQEARLTAQYTYNAETGALTEVGQFNVYRFGSDQYESGGAGLFCSVDSYMKFASCLADYGKTPDGYVLLKPETIDLIRNTDEMPPMAQATFDLHGLGYYRYGLGMRVLSEPKGLRTPKGEFGWDGAASAYASYSPEAGVAIFFGMQVLGTGHMYRIVHPRIREAVYEGLGFPVQ